MKNCPGLILLSFVQTVQPSECEKSGEMFERRRHETLGGSALPEEIEILRLGNAISSVLVLGRQFLKECLVNWSLLL